MSVVYGLGISVFGGFAQFFVTWLLHVTRNPMAPAWYLMVTVTLSTVVLFWIRTAPGMTSTIRRHDAVPLFSDSYAQARERFLAAAKAVAARMASYPIEARGARDEALSTDVALIGDAKAERLLIMTSATHGAEGFCGSGCQLALLDDAPMLARARDSGVALLLVHAVNPGFRGLRAPTRATST